MEQGFFNFKNTNKYLATSYLVSSSNQQVFSCVNSLNIKTFLISGPPKSGKTHLTHIWKEKNNAKFINSEQMSARNEFEIQELLEFIKPEASYIIDDLEKKLFNENVLFHLLNDVAEKNSKLFLTSIYRSNGFSLSLKDLSSRFNNLDNFSIEHPDENLIKMLFVKFFSDKQISVDSNVVEFLLKKVKRTYQGVYDVVNILDDYSKKRKQRITIPVLGTLKI